MRWMIKGAAMITGDEEDRWFEKGDIVMGDGKIIALGRDLSPESFRVEKICQGENKLVIPGLVNAHLHSNDRFDKGRFDNLPLELWGVLYNPPLGKREWTSRECYLRTAINCIEMLKTGTTTVLDDVRHGAPGSKENIDAVFEAYQDSGMRALVGIGYSDLPYYRTIPYLEGLLPSDLKKEIGLSMTSPPEEVIRLWRNYAERWNGRVGFLLSPSAPQRCTDEFLKKTWRLSEEMDLPVIVHVLETKVQAVAGKLFYGKSIIEHMKALRVLTPRTAIVHAVWVDDHDIEMISESGASIVHNPVANLKLGSGIAPIRKVLDAGINVGLGTDNNNANDTANLFETMKMAALLHKVPDPNYDRWVGAKEVMKMATRGGARCGYLKNLGSLSVGMKADMALFDLSKLPFFPRNNLLHQLVFCENGGSVDTVVIDGRPVVEGGRVTTLNEEKIAEEARERAEEIQGKIRRAASRGVELEPFVREAYRKCVLDA